MKTLIATDPALLEGFSAVLTDSLNMLRQYKDENAQLREQARRAQLLDLDGACAYLKKKPATLYYYYTEMGLPYIKKGKNSLWFITGDIDDWLDSGKVNQRNS